jgi:hypothetical protein
MAAALALAALSLLVVPAAPSYDAWSWLLWGREVVGLGLSTAEGPAWKPLPVAVCALLSGFGAAAPVLWVVVARAGAVVGIALAFLLARELAVGSRRLAAGWQLAVGGVAAAVGVGLTGGFLSLAAQGNSEGLFLALALGGGLACLRGAPRVAVACFVGCALLRVESWPFLVVLAWWYGWRWRLVGSAAAVVALWFVPEWLGSGELLRSAERARVPNAGQPALADVPALASIGDALPLLFWPVVAGALFAPRAARVVAGAGVAWIALVALMAQAGFSGEWRYAVPGAAAVAVAGAAGLAARPRLAVALAVPAVALAGVRLADLPALRDREQSRAQLVGDLRRAVAQAGGAREVLRCGRPYVGHFRGPLLAYALAVEKRRVGFDPAGRGVVFRSLTDSDRAPAPGAPSYFRAVAEAGRWTVLATCVD